MEHNHLIHDLLIFIPLLFAFIFHFRKQLFHLSKLRLLTILALIIFSGIHLNPTKLTFAYHHQSPDSQHHPCCMPQISHSVILFEIPIVITFTQEPEAYPKTFHPLLTINSQNSRSPPIS